LLLLLLLLLLLFVVVGANDCPRYTYTRVA